MPKNHTIRTAVIPIAGKGRRMYPLTAAAPKEMLATAEGPVIELVVRELIQSEIEHIILVTMPGKEVIQQHLEAVDLPLLSNGKKTVLTYVDQDNIPGNGGAILTAAKITKDEPFVVVWGDELFLGDIPRTRQLVEVYESTLKPVIALTEVEPEDVYKCGIAKISKELSPGTFELSAIVEKPSVKDAPSRLASVGGYVVTPEIVAILKVTQPSPDGEIYLSTALNKYSSNKPLLGKLIESEWPLTTLHFIASRLAIARNVAQHCGGDLRLRERRVHPEELRRPTAHHCILNVAQVVRTLLELRLGVATNNTPHGFFGIELQQESVRRPKCQRVDDFHVSHVRPTLQEVPEAGVDVANADDVSTSTERREDDLIDVHHSIGRTQHCQRVLSNVRFAVLDERLDRGLIPIPIGGAFGYENLAPQTPEMIRKQLCLRVLAGAINPLNDDKLTASVHCSASRSTCPSILPELR